MRGLILWAAVGIAAIVTGLGLYAAALQTSPTTITNPPAQAEPAAVVTTAPTPGPTDASDDSGGRVEGSDDHGGDRDRPDRDDDRSGSSDDD